MAVAFRAAGSWENGSTGLTADEVLAVPAAQVTGDLILVLASWKDFAITAQVSGYTEITEFADGSVGTGNGLGSMKVGAWYKIAASDTEADPTLDFSTTTGLLGEGTILVFSKGSAETWLTPGFVTAAWPSQSTGTISASSTITVPDAGAVIGMIGIRDDSATYTRPTTGIDTASGVTWNGNYVEAPGTHASTTTGNDMAVDAGYRLVTTGGAGITLRQTITSLSASETGAALWIVIGATTLVTPTTASLSLTTFAPTVTATENQLVTPTTASLVLATFAPTVTASDHKIVTPDIAALTLTTFAPTVTASDHKIVTPDPASLSLTTFEPTVTVSNNVVITPDPGALTLTTFAPTVTVTEHQVVTPGTASLILTTFAPEVTASDHKLVVPTTASLLMTAFAPDVIISDHKIVTPSPASLVLTTFEPTVTVSGGDVLVTPATASLVLSTFAPTVTVGAPSILPVGDVLTLTIVTAPVGISIDGVGVELSITSGSLELEIEP